MTLKSRDSAPLSKHLEYNVILFQKKESSISTYNINSGKMNITGSSSRLNEILKGYTGWDFVVWPSAVYVDSVCTKFSS